MSDLVGCKSSSPVIIYCLFLGTYGEETDGPRNGLAATAGGGCNDALISRGLAGRPPEPRPHVSACTLGLWAFAAGLLIGVFLL
jgi:hypothetical protein